MNKKLKQFTNYLIVFLFGFIFGSGLTLMYLAIECVVKKIN